MTSACAFGRGGLRARNALRLRPCSACCARLPWSQCQGEVAALCGGWILITWCLARSLVAAFGLAFMRFVDIRCEGPAGVT